MFFLFFVMQKVTVFRIRITLYESRFEIYFLRERLLSFKRNRVGRNSMEGMSFRCSCGKTNRFVCRRLKWEYKPSIIAVVVQWCALSRPQIKNVDVILKNDLKLSNYLNEWHFLWPKKLAVHKNTRVCVHKRRLVCAKDQNLACIKAANYIKKIKKPLKPRYRFSFTIYNQHLAIYKLFGQWYSYSMLQHGQTH